MLAFSGQRFTHLLKAISQLSSLDVVEVRLNGRHTGIKRVSIKHLSEGKKRANVLYYPTVWEDELFALESYLNERAKRGSEGMVSVARSIRQYIASKEWIETERCQQQGQTPTA